MILCQLCVYYMYTGPESSIVFQSTTLTLWTGTSTSVMGSFGEHVATIICTWVRTVCNCNSMYIRVYSICNTVIDDGWHSVMMNLPNI